VKRQHQAKKNVAAAYHGEEEMTGNENIVRKRKRCMTLTKHLKMASRQKNMKERGVISEESSEEISIEAVAERKRRRKRQSKYLIIVKCARAPQCET